MTGGLQPFREYFWTGRAMRSLKAESASEDRVTIGFVDPNADRIAHVNNLAPAGVRWLAGGRIDVKAVVLAVLRRGLARAA